MQMTKDLYWIKRQIVVLNVVGSNPTGHPFKSLKSLDFQGLFFLCSTHWASRGNEHQRKITSYSDQYRYRSKSGSGRGKTSSTTTDITAKVAVVAAKHRRPLPISQPKWQWSRQTESFKRWLFLDCSEFLREKGADSTGLFCEKLIG